MRLVLASSSPRRAALLGQIGLEFEVWVPQVDETRFPDEEPIKYVERIARLKATEVAMPGSVTIAGDTAVVNQGRVLGKPSHPEEARSMLRSLQGGVHEVLTGIAVARVQRGEIEPWSLVDATTVRMVPMTDAEIVEYVDSGEPLDKAGAYGIGGIGARYIEGIVGSPSTVAGLPVHLVGRLLEVAGFPIKLSKLA